MHSKKIATKRKRSKSGKRDFSDADVQKIPKDVLERALEVLNSPEQADVGDNCLQCANYIHLHRPFDIDLTRTYMEPNKIQMARSCLLQRDWHNLARVLSLSNATGPRASICLYPLCVKYAAICLAHNDEELFNLYMKSLIPVESSELLTKCTQFPIYTKEE